jgi:hypothetical protein
MSYSSKLEGRVLERKSFRKKIDIKNIEVTK